MKMTLSFTNILRKNLYWIVGAFITMFFIAFTEGSLIWTTKQFGVTKATLIRVAFTIPLSWFVIYLSTKSNRSFHFSKWLAEKETALSKRARLAVQSGKFIAVLNAAVFLGPIIASILMLIIGIEIKKIYIYAIACAFLCAALWCSFYSGVLWGIGRILLFKV